MKICNLTSGSDGNLTYIESVNAKILVDIGLSCLETEKRLGYLKVNPENIDAIFISHEHYDHMKGLNIFANKYKTKVFVHEDGYYPLLNKLKKTLNINTFNDKGFDFKDITVQTVGLPHDVKRCTGYSFIEQQKKVSIITDLGHTTKEILQNLKDSKLIFLESNHDIEMLLENENYPEMLKQRILGQNGHLSNNTCAEAVINLFKAGTKHFVLSHLSTKNNTPRLAYNFINQILINNGISVGEDVKIDVASVVPKAIYNLK
ncbi:MAG: MBL fold metallo-hydrolase [Clostridia bacterium]|nr:MBL fold metallo-hydrolase [Clostridia bacterium]MDD4685997.1 MBL fold metallo-hydrolase [Clostridia bacterium]